MVVSFATMSADSVAVSLIHPDLSSLSSVVLNSPLSLKSCFVTFSFTALSAVSSSVIDSFSVTDSSMVFTCNLLTFSASLVCASLVWSSPSPEFSAVKHVSWGSTESTSVSCTCCLWSGKQEATAPLSFIPSVQRTRLSVSSWQTGFKADSALHRSVISSLLSTLSWHIEASNLSLFPQESSSCLLTWILSCCSSRALHPSRTPSLSSMGFKTVWPVNSCPSSLKAETTAILNPYIGLFGEDLAKSCKDNSPSVLTTSWERSPIGDSAPTPSSRSVKIMSRLSRLLLISWISSLIPSKFLRAREYFRFTFLRLSWVHSTCRLWAWTTKKSMSKPEKTYRIRRFPKGSMILEMMVTTCGLFRVLFVSVLGCFIVIL